ncbi:hypothetical protein NE237_025437 [Protea cynaroides]|uniref:Uncharacterized protein n=1 Tax=Protea cynaroides TaxID=273540 RepID=A0A9Q0H1W3_9MAGN|nr:hypothetical protein NE237_025437 [Protea cynaroides]
MAILINCCLNISPPPLLPPLSFSTLKSNGISRKEMEERRSWRNQVLVGAACMIIGSSPLMMKNDSCAYAEELKFIAKEERWSEKRICPPWMMNSLETIVPENLPRPSAHRKFEAITLSSTAPLSSQTTVKAIKSNCFSL